MKKDIVNFLKKQNSAHAHKMAEGASKIEAWPVEEPSDEPNGKPENITEVSDFEKNNLRDTWVLLRFTYAESRYDGKPKTTQEAFYNHAV